MAEETDFSRTEPASPRRLQEARPRGDLPRSGEFSAWLVLVATLAALSWQAPKLLHSMQTLFRAAFVDAAHSSPTILAESLHGMLWAVLPVLAVAFFAALVAPLLLSGWMYAPPHAEFARTSPVKPVVRLLSADAWFDVLLVVLKLSLAGVAVWWMLERIGPELSTAEDGTSLWSGGAWLWRGLLFLAAALALASALDAAWRWWRYLRRHAMTYQEVLAEAREAELPAEVRAQLQARLQQAGQGASRSAAAEDAPAEKLPAGAERKTVGEARG